MSYPLKKEDLTLYAITDRYWLNGNKLADVVENVLKNGATFLQLREKEFSHEEMVQDSSRSGCHGGCDCYGHHIRRETVR